MTYEPTTPEGLFLIVQIAIEHARLQPLAVGRIQPNEYRIGTIGTLRFRLNEQNALLAEFTYRTRPETVYQAVLQQESDPTALEALSDHFWDSVLQDQPINLDSLF